MFSNIMNYSVNGIDCQRRVFCLFVWRAMNELLKKHNNEFCCISRGSYASYQTCACSSFTPAIFFFFPSVLLQLNSGMLVHLGQEAELWLAGYSCDVTVPFCKQGGICFPPP